jgi:hypothetical protein
MSVVDRINQNIAMDSNGVFRGEQRVLILASCIDDGNVVIDSIVTNLFEISLLDSRIVWLDELTLYKLYNEGRFACSERIREGGFSAGVDGTRCDATYRRLCCQEHKSCVYA